MTILIANASRIRSGGGLLHLRRFVDFFIANNKTFDSLVVYLPGKLIDSFPVNSQVKYIAPPCSSFLPFQLLWELFIFPIQVRQTKPFVFFNLDAGSLCIVPFSMTLSQDMLSFEPKAMQTFFPSVAWFRLLVLRFVQLRSLHNSTFSIFLTKYAQSRLLRDRPDLLSRSFIIPHGVEQLTSNFIPQTHDRPELNIIYISHFSPYKHQVEVIQAFRLLIELGLDLSLTLVGKHPDTTYANSTLNNLPEDVRQRISVVPFIPPHSLPDYISNSHIGLFASSCENLPITLLELMSSGLPIACSNRGPMPSILQDSGIYFDPQVPISIASALYSLATCSDLRHSLSIKSYKLARAYTWENSMSLLFERMNDLAILCKSSAY